MRPPKVVSLEAFFTRVTESQLAGLTLELRSAGMLAGGARQPRASTITDPGWATLWMKRFKPIRIGRRFLIVPPWNSELETTRISVIVKPARAFGTGHHATTAGVLRALEREFAERRFRSALDVGTGSGILAIAMKLLGVRTVSGIDSDPEALENARENAQLHRLGHELEFSSAPLNTLRHRYDLIVANILAPTLIEMAPALTRLLARDGRLILSGILAREAGEVLRSYRPALRCVSIRRDHGWATMVMMRVLAR
jgi:ribosomal protein L11 methyltransferase